MRRGDCYGSEWRNRPQVRSTFDYASVGFFLRIVRGQLVCKMTVPVVSRVFIPFSHHEALANQNIQPDRCRTNEVPFAKPMGIEDVRLGPQVCPNHSMADGFHEGSRKPSELRQAFCITPAD